MTKSGQVFNYNYSSKTSLQFKGKWYGKNIEVSMKEFPVDSMSLKKEEKNVIIRLKQGNHSLISKKLQATT